MPVYTIDFSFSLQTIKAFSKTENRKDYFGSWKLLIAFCFYHFYSIVDICPVYKTLLPERKDLRANFSRLFFYSLTMPVRIAFVRTRAECSHVWSVAQAHLNRHHLVFQILFSFEKIKLKKKIINFI